MDRAAFAFSRIERLDAADTIDAVVAELSEAGQNFGLGNVIIAGLPAPDKHLEPYMLLHCWPSGWYQRYNERDYLHVDPVVQKLRNTTRPVAWHEAPYDPHADLSAHAVMMEAREFQLKGGLSVPIYTLSGDQAAASFGGAQFDLSTEDRAALHLIAIYGHARAQELKKRSLETKRTRSSLVRPALTPREAEVLKWVAAGKTSDVIGEILNISIATVDTHVVNICRKLDTVNRTQAVAEAIRSRLIP